MPGTQEIFNKVWQYFVVEKHPKAEVDGTCMYRTPEGDKCAVGCLIPDELYDLDFEGEPIVAICKNYPSLVDYLGEDPRFLMYLQQVHDWSFNPEALRNKLTGLAEDYRLVVPEN